MNEQPIKTWHYFIGQTAYSLAYFKDKIISSYTNQGKSYPTTYDVLPYFRNGAFVSNDQTHHELYKLITSNPCPPNFNNLEKKRWSFWQALDSSKIIVENLPSTEAGKDFFPYNQYGTGIFQNDWQSLEQFFFFGPKRGGLPLVTRQRLREIILQALDASKHSLTLQDAFPLFDYKKLKSWEWKCTFDNDQRGERLAISSDGFVLVEGWEPNPYNCGGASYSIEEVWRLLDSTYPPYIIPSSLRNHIPELQEILKNAIVQNPHRA